MFTPTQLDAEPVYLDDEMEPENDFVEQEANFVEPVPTQIEFSQSQSLFPSESQIVQRLLQGRKNSLRNEISTYADISATVLARCKYLPLSLQDWFRINL